MVGSQITHLEEGFRFLQREYGFALADRRGDLSSPRHGCWVTFESPSTFVHVAIDEWGEVLPPGIGRVLDQKEAGSVGSLPLNRIYAFLKTRQEDRILLGSHAPPDLQRGLEAALEADADYGRLTKNEETRDVESHTIWEIGTHARLLREYGEPFLRGDFSSWPALHEYAFNWLVAGEVVSRRFSEGGRGGEVTRAEAEARFREIREYIEALREELG